MSKEFEKGAVVKVDDELSKVKQQLAIAVEALEKYSDLNNWIEVCDGKCTFESISGTEDHLAQDVIQKIKELENA